MHIFLRITRPVCIAITLIIVLSLTACRTDANNTDASDATGPTTSELPGENATAPPGIAVPVRAPTVTLASERWMHVLHGRDGQAVLLGITTDREISDFLDIAWDGATNGFVEGWEQIRAELIEESEQAFEFDGSSLRIIPRTGFNVTLKNSDMSDPMGREFDWLFYSVTSSTGESYVFPSDWEIGDDPAPLYDEDRSALYISTYLGIWRITADGKSSKLTSDEYDGNHYSWHVTEAFDPHVGWSPLFWTANAVLSPDNRYVIYRSNRDCYSDGSNMSVWRIDLDTGEEQRILTGDSINIIDGFVTDNLALINQRFLLDVSSGTTVPLILPELPNLYVSSVGSGNIICDSYREEDVGLSTLHVFRIEPETGVPTEVFAERGVFRGFGSSPSGKYAYALYGTEPNRGAETLMLFDFEKMSARLLEDVLGEVYDELGGTIIRANWLSDSAILLHVLSVADNNNAYSTWIADMYFQSVSE